MKIDWPSRGHAYVESDLSGLDEFLLSNMPLTSGEQVLKFENAFKNKFSLKSSFATMSCAHALDIVGKITIDSAEDEVIMPAHTYCATALGFARCGAKIRWADIDKESLTVSFSEIKRLVNKNTRVIVVVHLYGQICPEISQIAQYAEENNIILVEDCAQCIGASYQGIYAGGFGDFATFSFHAQKNMTTLGEGGMLAAKHPRYTDIIKGLRLNGHQPFSDQSKYWLPAMTDVRDMKNGRWPIKATLTEAQATVGLNVLNRLDDMNKYRKKIAVEIKAGLEDIPRLNFQSNLSSISHCNHLLPIHLHPSIHNRDDFILKMHDIYGIKCVTQYYPLYKYELFKHNNFGGGFLKNTENFYNNMASLPVSAETTAAECEYIIRSVRSVLGAA